MDTPLLEVKDLQMHYELASGKVLKAVDGVSFSMKRGDKLGIVGESACGKTSLAMTVQGLLPENARILGGEVFFQGKNLLQFSEREWRDVRWKKISMIFQAAMNALDPVYRIGKQLRDVYQLHYPCTNEEANERVAGLFRLTGLPASRMKSYPHQLSGGMKQRAIIAMSLLCNPDLIIADEPTTGLDVIIQDQIMREITSLIHQLHLSMLLISHDISVVAEVCNKILVMYGGRLVELGNMREVFTRPSHPYTICLFEAFPSVRGTIKSLIALPGSPPNLADDLGGCRFAPRCVRKETICEREDPPKVKLGEDHIVFCFFAEDVDLKRERFGGICA